MTDRPALLDERLHADTCEDYIIGQCPCPLGLAYRARRNPFPAPSSCGTCNTTERNHWGHAFVPPTAEQIKLRMIVRRAMRKETR